MPEIIVPWGDGDLTIALPEHWSLQEVITPSLRPAPSNWPERLAAGLGQPETGPPLHALLTARPGGKIVLVLEDITRESPLKEILPVLMREIRHAGIRDSQIEIVFATGMHVPMTAEQVGQKLGTSAEGIRWRCNPWMDSSAYEFLGRAGRVDVAVDRGVARADLRILVSSVSPHLQAGFGGGGKLLLPGCASLETIGALHRLGIGRGDRQLVGMAGLKNPMRRVIEAGCQLVDAFHGRTFAIEYLLDEHNKPAHIVTGEVTPTHQMLAKQCAVACGAIMDRPADVLITNAHPRDFDLWQSFKCIANTRWAVRPNGLIICLTRCPGGLGGMKVPPWPLSPAWTRGALRWLGAESLSSLVTRLAPRLAGDAAFFVRMATQTLYRNPILIVSPSLAGEAKGFPGLEIFAEAGEAVAAGERMLGGEPQRVIVFPAGGITFPAPRPVSPGAAE